MYVYIYIYIYISEQTKRKRERESKSDIPIISPHNMLAQRPNISMVPCRWHGNDDESTNDCRATD